MEFLTTNLLIAAGVAAAAGLMRGFAGVGSGMLMAPFFVLLFGPVQTVATIVLMEIVVTAQLLPGVHREIRWKVIAPMGLAAALLMPVGSWLLVTLDPRSPREIHRAGRARVLDHPDDRLALRAGRRRRG